MPHATLRTATNTIVNHALKFSGSEYTAAEKQQIQQQALNGYPGISPTYYTKLNLAQEELLPTKEYNCWGFTFDPRRSVISSGTDVANILNDNANPVPAGSVKRGDVICYKDSYGTITHTGRVWVVNSSGQATTIRSKWGRWGEYLHPPLTVPAIYGTDTSYWRMHTHLQGRAVLFIKDSNADNSFQYSPSPFWVSPDIWVDSDLDGTPDLNPIANQVNHVYAKVRNNGTVAINSVEVRFYWADPSGGIPAAAWNLIGTYTIPSIAANSDAVAGPVSWTPQPTPAHQCLLVIANGGDGITVDNEPDPIVYPFDVRWENCISMKNVTVITVKKGSSADVDFKVTNIKLEPAIIDLHIEEIRKGIAGKAGLDVRLPEDIKSEKYESEGATIHEFKGIQLQPEESRKIDLQIHVPEDAKPGEEYTYNAVQRIDGEVTGGVTYIIKVAEEETSGRQKAAAVILAILLIILLIIWLL